MNNVKLNKFNHVVYGKCSFNKMYYLTNKYIVRTYDL